MFEITAVSKTVPNVRCSWSPAAGNTKEQTTVYSIHVQLCRHPCMHASKSPSHNPGQGAVFGTAVVLALICQQAHAAELTNCILHHCGMCACTCQHEHGEELLVRTDNVSNAIRWSHHTTFGHSSLAYTIEATAPTLIRVRGSMTRQAMTAAFQSACLSRATIAPCRSSPTDMPCCHPIQDAPQMMQARYHHDVTVHESTRVTSSRMIHAAAPTSRVIILNLFSL